MRFASFPVKKSGSLVVRNEARSGGDRCRWGCPGRCCHGGGRAGRRCGGEPQADSSPLSRAANVPPTSSPAAHSWLTCTCSGGEPRGRSSPSVALPPAALRQRGRGDAGRGGCRHVGCCTSTAAPVLARAWEPGRGRVALRAEPLDPGSIAAPAALVAAPTARGGRRRAGAGPGADALRARGRRRSRRVLPPLSPRPTARAAVAPPSPPAPTPASLALGGAWPGRWSSS